MKSALQQQLIRDLLVESFEGLDRFDREVLSLEKGPPSSETLNSIFRIIHTLKGTSGCLGFGKIEKLAHTGENLLEQLRAGKTAGPQSLVTPLLQLSDALRAMLKHIEATGAPGDADHRDLIQQLDALAAGRPTVNAALPSLPENGPAEGFGLFVENTPAAPPNAKGDNASPLPSALSDAAVRVDVGQLDRLMNLVGELVLARNQIVQSRGLRGDATLAAAAQRLNVITAELQEGVMKTRMQPIGNVWAKFPRIVRDVAHDLGKQVRLELEGRETELDRTLIEAIRDPLTHIVRNAIDHGIEAPAERTRRGKSEEGRLLLRAFHESSQVNIEISDDGAGLDANRIRQKGIEKGLLTAEESARLSDRESFNLIFLPGFSTAEKVTHLSGRGVGMDVVKTNVERIGGTVDITSAPGRGTTFKLKIPLTLAIVPALIIRSGGARYALPRPNLVELVRLEGAAALKAREDVCGAPVLRLRERLLPLLSLDEQLGRARSRESEALNIVVLQADQRRFGLVVDEILDSEEIVVKPLRRHLKGLPMYAGATIMGDGTVALILDVLGLAEHAAVVSEGNAPARESPGAEAPTKKKNSLLLFSLPGRARLAIPLDQANRLEKVPSAAIESSGGREAIQYRGRILPLVRLEERLPGVAKPTQSHTGDLPVIIHRSGEVLQGLVVESIIDIIDEELVFQTTRPVPGLAGTAVLQGRITDVVDLDALLNAPSQP